jgi:hypothetical protein
LCVFLEEIMEILLDGEARRDRLQGGIRFALGGVEVELFALCKADFCTTLYDSLEEGAEGFKPVAVPDPGEAGVGR